MALAAIGFVSILQFNFGYANLGPYFTKEKPSKYSEMKFHLFLYANNPF